MIDSSFSRPFGPIELPACDVGVLALCTSCGDPSRRRVDPPAISWVTEQGSLRVPEMPEGWTRVGVSEFFTSPAHREHVRFTPGRLGSNSAGWSRSHRSSSQVFSKLKVSTTVLTEGRSRVDVTRRSRREAPDTNRAASLAPPSGQGPTALPLLSSRSWDVVLSRGRTDANGGVSNPPLCW